MLAWAKDPIGKERKGTKGREGKRRKVKKKEKEISVGTET
jgi:hypothetical protein